MSFQGVSINRGDEESQKDKGALLNNLKD